MLKETTGAFDGVSKLKIWSVVVFVWLEFRTFIKQTGVNLAILNFGMFVTTSWISLVNCLAKFYVFYEKRNKWVLQLNESEILPKGLLSQYVPDTHW